MKDGYLITFRSVTFAQKGERMLLQSGILCTMRRTPRQLSARGCGYCLQVRREDGPMAVEVLRQRQIPYGKVYALTDGAEPEEQTL